MKSTASLLGLGLALAASAAALADNAPAQAEAAAPAAAPAAAAATAAPAYTDEQLLEEMGWFVGKRTGLSELGFTPAQAELLAKGLSEAASGKDSPYEVQKIGPAMSEFMEKKQAILEKKQAADTAVIKAKNAAEGAKYLATLKDIKDVVELPSGLRYEIITQGTGVAPKATDTVRVNYTGTLVDGTIFDSSERQHKPLDIALNEVIPGWTEGLQKIQKGGKIRLFIPPNLGYGDKNLPGIPPGSVLVFEVELVDVLAGTPPDGANIK